MCGIFALIPSGNKYTDWTRILPRAIQAVSERGRDSIGVAFYYSDGRVFCFKNQGNAHDFLTEYKKDLFDLFYQINSRPLCILGVARAQPLQEVLPTNERDNPPFKYKEWIIVHNGIVSNDKELIERFNLKDLETMNDTMIMLRYLTKEGRFRIKQGKELIPGIQGSAAFLLLDTKRKQLYYYRDFKPLFFAKNLCGDALYISTEEMASFSLMKTNFEMIVNEINLYELGRFNLRTYREYDSINPSLIRIQNVRTSRVHHMSNRDPRKVLAVCSGGLDSTCFLIMDKKLHQLSYML